MHEVDRDRLVNYFLDLVAIDAVSLKERPVNDYLCRFLDSWNLSYAEDQAGSHVGGNAGNLIVSVDGEGDSGLFLCAHTDTVRPTAKLSARIENGVITSDGTTILGADNRSGVAVLLYLLDEAAHQRFKPRRFHVFFTIAEEIGLLGAANLDVASIPIRGGFVFDSSSPPGDYITQTPTALELQVDIFGAPAHAGVAPEQGINALSMAAEVLTGFPVGRIDAETVANFGLIRGGEATNVVPAHIHLDGELRTFKADKGASRIKQLESVLARVTEKYGGGYELRHAEHFQGFSIADDHPLARYLAERMQRVGLKARPRVYSGGSDANVFNARGVPSINLGVGQQNPHANTERIAIADLVKAAELAIALVAAS